MEDQLEIQEEQLPQQETPAELFPEAAKMPIFWANLLAVEKIIVNQGGMYSGKTEAIMRVLIFYAIHIANCIIDVVANSVPKLKEDTMKVAERIFETNPIVKTFLKIPFNKSDRIYTFKNGSTINFKSYDSSEQAEGAKRHILYMNECRRINYGTAFLLIKRTSFKCFMDYNPVAKFWVHDEIINCPVVNGKREYSSVKVIRSWHIHNLFISEEKREEIENIADKEMHKAYARGLTAQISGLVYPNVDEYPEFPHNAKDIIWGIDLGFTNDPTVILKIALNYGGYDAIVEEYGYAPGIPSGDMAHIMKTNGYKFGQPVYIDPNKTVQRELRNIRIVAISAHKGEGSVFAGIIHVRSKRVAITKKSTNLRHELRRHSFALDREGNTTNEPEHQYSHGPSALRYGMYSHAVRYGQVKGGGESGKEEES